MSQDKPLISVIVPAYNAEKTIKGCIDSLLKQSYRMYEVIVVDNNSTDDTRRILESFGEKIKTLKEVKKGSFAARNTGVKNSNGEVIAFVDADCIVENNWLDKLTEPLLSGGEVAAYGGSVDAQETRWSRMEHVYEESIIDGFSEGGYIQMGDTKNLAIKRDVFLGIGGFDESYEWSGDTDFGLRLAEAGHRIRRVRECRVKHYFKATLRKIIRNKFRHGFWGVKIYIKHKGKHGEYLHNYGRVLKEVKYGLYSLALSAIPLAAWTVYGGQGNLLLASSTVMVFSGVFMLAGANHTIVPILKKGLSDYNIYGLLHSTAWRTGALWYMMKHPSSVSGIP